MLLFGCQEDIDLDGNIEVHVREVSTVCSINYSELEIGLFPTEILSQGSFAFNSIESLIIDENGTVKFNSLPSGIYIVAIKASFCNSWKYATVRSGKTDVIELID
jgi:hypothetical protein